MKHAVLMSLHVEMVAAYKNVGFVIVTMIVVIIRMKQLVHQQHVHQIRNSLVQLIIVLRPNGVVTVNQIVQMEMMKG